MTLPIIFARDQGKVNATLIKNAIREKAQNVSMLFCMRSKKRCQILQK